MLYPVIHISSCRATTYCEGALLGRGNCACGMNNSCADSSSGCNGDKDDAVWREDSGLLTDKTKLPAIQLRFVNTEGNSLGRLLHSGKIYVICYSTISWSWLSYTKTFGFRHNLFLWSGALKEDCNYRQLQLRVIYKFLDSKAIATISSMSAEIYQCLTVETI